MGNVPRHPELVSRSIPLRAPIFAGWMLKRVQRDGSGEDLLSYSRFDVHGRDMNLNRATVPGKNWRSPRARAHGTSNFADFRPASINSRTGVNFVNFASVETL